MKYLPDFSEWLTDERIAVEEKAWAETEQYKRNASQVLKMVHRLAAPFPTVLELGCGSGWVPFGLGDVVRYLGVDKNSELIRLCYLRNPYDAKFHLSDIREVTPDVLESLLGVRCADIVCSFAVLKHFGLYEWREIFERMLRLGNHGVFQMQISDEASIDDGTEYHHTWLNKDEVLGCIVDAGHSLVSFDETWRGGPLAEWTLYTKRLL